MSNVNLWVHVAFFALVVGLAIRGKPQTHDYMLHFIAWMTGRRVVYMNLYKSGWFHRCGKPQTLDRHAGDCYTTRAQARADIDPPHHYICTVAVVYRDPDCGLKVNSPESKPVPLSVTRRDAMHAARTYTMPLAERGSERFGPGKGYPPTLQGEEP